MTEHPQPIITDNPAAQRFEAHVDGKLAGFVDYTDAEQVRTFPHTEVDPEFGGRGIGSVLVDEAMRATIADSKQIHPVCPFVVDRARADEFAGHVSK